MGTKTKTETHTPGPWRLASGGAFENITVDRAYGVAFESMPTVQVFVKIPLYRDEAKEAKSIAEARANARLIAAAPELLEALKLARKKWGQLHDFISNMVEERGLITEDAFPDDYQAIVAALLGGNEAEAVVVAAIAKAE